MVARPKVALVGNTSGFARRDAALLRDLGAEVEHVGPGPSRVVRAIRRATHVICWFGGEHSFYARLFSRKKPMALLLGGVEGCDGPRYGLWGKRWDIRARARWSIWNADELWAVAPHVAWRTLALTGIASRYRRPRIVHTVFDPNDFPILPKDGSTVFACLSGEAVYAMRKGLRDVLGSDLPNVNLLRNAPEQEYRETLGRAAVVLNASTYEGLCNTLCEGMLAGAVPVMSDIDGNRHAAFGLREARFFPTGQRDSMREKVLDALSDGCDPYKVREHILRRFPIEARRREFARFLEVE